MNDYYNIPDRMLKTISTEELIKFVFEYPLLINLFSYKSFNNGIYFMASYFNGMRELIMRMDAGDILLKIYEGLEIGSIIDSDNYIKICVTEMLLAQTNIYSSFKEEKIIKLNKQIAEKQKIRKQINIFKRTENIFLETRNQREITSVSMEGKSLGMDTVYTPNGSPVKVVRISDYSPIEKELCDIAFKKAYPNSIFVSSCTYNYNCHSYAFYYSFPDNIFWMNDPSQYFIDGSYQYRGTYPTSNQQKIYYDTSQNSHAGIVLDYFQNIVISKWGSGPLMIHDYRDCPYYIKDKVVLKYYD